MDEKQLPQKSLTVRILLAVILTVCMALMITPINTVTVSAATGDVKVAGQLVSGDSTSYWKNKADKSGIENGTSADWNVKYETASVSAPAKLTLSGLDLNDLSEHGIYPWQGTDLDIVLVNDNTINTADAGKCGILAPRGSNNSGTVTISGTGSLDISGANTNAIRANNLIIKGDVTLTATAGNAAPTACNGIYTINDLTISENAEVSATSGDGVYSAGIYVETGDFTASTANTITASSGTATKSADSDACSSTGIRVGGDFNVSNGTSIVATAENATNGDSYGISIKDDFTNGGTVVATAGAATGTAQYQGLSAGIHIYQGDLKNSGSGDITAEFGADSTYGAGIALGGNMENSGTIDATGNSSNMSVGIFMIQFKDAANVVHGGSLTCTGGEINATGMWYGLSMAKDSDTVPGDISATVSGGKLIGTATNTTGYGVGIDIAGKLTVSGTGNNGGYVKGDSAGTATIADVSAIRAAIYVDSIELKDDRGVTIPTDGITKKVKIAGEDAFMIYNKAGDTLQSDAVIQQVEHRLIITSPTFDTVTAGYEQPAKKAFTIKNVGSKTASNIAITLDGPDRDAFVVVSPDPGRSLASGATITEGYTIQPKQGLKAGTYKAKVNFLYLDGNIENIATADVTFKVNAAGKKDTDKNNASKINTGDDSNMTLWIVLACLALAGAGGTTFAFRRKNNKVQ